MIANGRSGQQNKVRFYKAKDNSKKMITVGYKKFFLLRVIRPDTGTTNLVYIVENEINHCNMWNQFTSIRDNGGITIGTIIRFFVRNHMKTLCRMESLQLSQYFQLQ